MASDGRDIDVGGGDQDRLLAHGIGKRHHEVEPLFGLFVGIRAEEGLAVPGAETGVVRVTVDANCSDAFLLEVPHEVQASLKYGCNYCGRQKSLARLSPR